MLKSKHQGRFYYLGNWTQLNQMTVGGTENYTTLYTYDLNNRLLTETKNAGTEGELREYHYDANGNTILRLCAEWLILQSGS